MKTATKRAKATAAVADVVAVLAKLIRIEPTCIKCGCTQFNACDEGCSWTFLNKKTNEGICSACWVDISKGFPAGGEMERALRAARR
jgi:hypothetical protein